jgi:diguanylate cyclase (GGDEF)-like protein
MSATLFASYSVQALGALLTAGICGSFKSTGSKAFLRYWARSWMALFVVFAGAAVSAGLASKIPASDPARIVVSVITSVASYLQAAWLVFGAAELLHEGSVTARRQTLAVAGAVALGILAALLFTWSPDDAGRAARFIVRVGVRGVVVGIAFMIAAVCVWRSREPALGIGRMIVGVALVLYGIDQLHSIWLTVASAMARDTSYALYMGFLDFILTFAIGLGVVIWLLEDERRIAHDFAKHVEGMAYHDALTGLPNRQLFLDHLNLALPHARRASHKLAVFFVDLDRFKVINDSLGHGVGDKVLQVVGQRVKEILRETDTVARMGGDEFTVLATVVNNVSDATQVAVKVQDAIRLPIKVDGRELFVTASMGIAVYPDDGETAETLLKNADTAMYRAKGQGSDLFQLYTAQMNSQALEHLALESAMRRACSNSEFELHYQPIVEMAENRVRCMEAMIRWRHPELGFLRPDHFLGVAETTGMIVQIGEWTMNESFRQLHLWRRDHPDLRVALNASTRQLRQPDFVELVRRLLLEHGLPGDALELEISEVSAAQIDEPATNRLRELRAMGVRIAIDDFGTGYTSLAKLRAFPVDALKIDTTFVRDLVTNPRNAEIAAAVIALAKALKLSVTAEGVENPGQLEFLREQGAEQWQGYLCCPPVGAVEAGGAIGRKQGTAPPPPLSRRVRV